jgi:hypothetical protein
MFGKEKMILLMKIKNFPAARDISGKFPINFFFLKNFFFFIVYLAVIWLLLVY